VFFRGNERQMWLVKANRKEEGLVLAVGARAQELHRPLRRLAVAQGIVRHLRRLERSTARPVVRVLELLPCRAGVCDQLIAHGRLLGSPNRILWQPVRLAPGHWIVLRPKTGLGVHVENFPERYGSVAV